MTISNTQQKVDLKSFGERYKAVHRHGIWYRCPECQTDFSEDDAVWKVVGTGNHATETTHCPECGSEEIIEL